MWPPLCLGQGEGWDARFTTTLTQDAIPEGSWLVGPYQSAACCPSKSVGLIPHKAWKTLHRLPVEDRSGDSAPLWMYARVRSALALDSAPGDFRVLRMWVWGHPTNFYLGDEKSSDGRIRLPSSVGRREEMGCSSHRSADCAWKGDEFDCIPLLRSFGRALEQGQEG